MKTPSTFGEIMNKAAQDAKEQEKAELSGKAAELRDMLKAHSGERHVIVLQDYPDPDAIAAGFAHQVISSAFGIETEIFYDGKISHQENIALVKLLKIDLRRFSKELDLSEYHGAVFVDNQGTTAHSLFKAIEDKKVPIVAVIDHHEHQNHIHPEFLDVRPVGAAVSLYAEYLQHGLFRLDPGNERHVALATAMMHGIITDTAGFVQAGHDDFMAASFLSRYRDSETLGQIMNQSRSKRVMELIYYALGNRVTVENMSIAGIGYLRADDRDAIPQAADFLISEENVHTAVVYGIVTGKDWDEALIGSLRTSKLTLDPDEFIKDVFGQDVSGQYFGGGKLSAGGFQIPVGFLAGSGNEEFRDLKWKTFDEQVKQKIFAKLGLNENDQS
jgi:nanoRNase/pAp phosphatase (c-di-AMP/oligoRNAs hydrolase)